VNQNTIKRTIKTVSVICHEEEGIKVDLANVGLKPEGGLETS
jgi:hypothetical protein